MSNTQDHLDKGARALLDAPTEKRIRYIEQDRFIPYRAINRILDQLDNFVNRPASIRPPCLALIGDSGCGKSTLMEEAVHRHTIPDNPNIRKVVYCMLDPLPELKVSQRALLTALGVPPTLSLLRPRTDSDDLISRSIKELGARMILFDETGHMHNLPRAALRLQWDWIKWVSTANRVSVVCTGIPGFEQTVRREDQLETRFGIVRIPRWTVGPAFQQFLTSYELSLPLRRPSGLGTVSMQEALLRESGHKQQIAGLTQGIKQVVEHAAIEAIRSGEERVTLNMLSAWRDGYEPDAPAKPTSSSTSDTKGAR